MNNLSNPKIGVKPFEYPTREFEELHGGPYTLEQVLSDLIDNSIDANATFAEVIIDKQDMGNERKEYNGGLQGDNRLYCIVLDNGFGIKQDRLSSVLSRGVTRPAENPYKEYELGAFGVGLKTSSLCQAYELTLFSKVKGEETHCMRLSSTVVKRHDKNLILRHNEFDPWMKETKGYKQALDLLSEQDQGTVVLLEGLHKLEIDIGEGEREIWENKIETRIKNYLGLVFHYYIQGTEVPKSDGTKIMKKIELRYGGPKSLIEPLDPFCQDPKWQTGLRDGTTSLHKYFDTKGGEGQIKRLSVRAWFIPHESMPGRIKHQNRMASTKRINSILKMHGVYVYRNRRLIEFCSTEDPWKGIIAGTDHQTYHRWEIHLPPGENVGRDGSDFILNTSKSQVKFSVDVRKKLRHWGSKPGAKWHKDDPRIVSARERGILRQGKENSWKICKRCGGKDHLTSKCKKLKTPKPVVTAPATATPPTSMPTATAPATATPLTSIPAVTAPATATPLTSIPIATTPTTDALNQVNVKSVTCGKLIDVKVENEILSLEINSAHILFSELENQLKKIIR